MGMSFLVFEAEHILIRLKIWIMSEVGDKGVRSDMDLKEFRTAFLRSKEHMLSLNIIE